MHSGRDEVITSQSIDPATGREMYYSCASCDQDGHRCHFCGQDLTHSGHDNQGNLHDTAFCRPDLVEHEPGALCTWPDKPELRGIPGYEPGCYWDHENNRLKGE